MRHVHGYRAHKVGGNFSIYRDKFLREGLSDAVGARRVLSLRAKAAGESERGTAGCLEGRLVNGFSIDVDRMQSTLAHVLVLV